MLDYLSFIKTIVPPDSIAHSLILVFLVSALGILIGNIKFFRVRIGLAAVLFVGLIFAHFGFKVHSEFLEFMREFGLILFVYTIGIQVGPRFFSSFGKNGWLLNIMAVSIVLLGGLIALFLHYGWGLDPTVVVGLFSGATTNTPSLGAAQQILKEIGTLSPESLKNPGLAYAVAYPFGVFGIILSLKFLKTIYKINLSDEISDFTKSFQTNQSNIERMNIEITNTNVDGLRIKEVPSLKESEVVISRILHKGEVLVATSDSFLRKGDIILAVGDHANLEKIRIVLGVESKQDLRNLPSSISAETIIVTRSDVIGKTPRDLNLFKQFGVTLTRAHRAEIQVTTTSHYNFQFGDRVTAIGEEKALKKVAEILGNSKKKLDQPEIVTFFFGIVLGLFIGGIPFYIPGVSVPVKLGMAGGPLIVALVLSRLGHIGRLVWYLPTSANLTLREFGIMIFLACVGLKAGDQFFSQLLSGNGVQWLLAGAMITLIPILIVGVIARQFVKLNYLAICGLLAGSMTDPPALAYANEVTDSEGPSIFYATVYPLTMVMRIVVAQLLVIIFL